MFWKKRSVRTDLIVLGVWIVVFGRCEFDSNGKLVRVLQGEVEEYQIVEALQ